MRRIIAALRRAYPGSRTALVHRTPFELLAATVLSAQSTDRIVNRITPVLFAAYPTIAALAAAAQSDVEEIVHPAGFFRVKARHLIDSAGRLLHEFGGEVPRTMAELVTLPGVSRKTANIVLSQAFGKAEGIAVDTHVTRLTQRMGLTQDHRPVKIEQDLMQVVPRRDWGAWNTLLVDHGRAVCRARRPECRACIIARWCPRRKVELVWKKGLT